MTIDFADYPLGTMEGFPPTLNVTVSLEDAVNGEYLSHTNCVIALAVARTLKEAGVPGVSVGVRPLTNSVSVMNSMGEKAVYRCIIDHSRFDSSIGLSFRQAGSTFFMVLENDDK